MLGLQYTPRENGSHLVDGRVDRVGALARPYVANSQRATAAPAGSSITQ